MDAASLIIVAKNTKAITEFVSGGGLREAMSSIVGDVHVDAAKLALETASISVSPRDRINSVISHLEAAHAAYASIHGASDSLYKKSTEWQQINNSVAKDAWVCCLMALCYASLRDLPAVEFTLKMADQAFENGDRAAKISTGGALIGLPLVLLALFNPRNWDFQHELMTREKYDAFKAELAEISSQESIS